jgi:hypothetical protein
MNFTIQFEIPPGLTDAQKVVKFATEAVFQAMAQLEPMAHVGTTRVGLAYTRQGDEYCATGQSTLDPSGPEPILMGMVMVGDGQVAAEKETGVEKEIVIIRSVCDALTAVRAEISTIFAGMSSRLRADEARNADRALYRLLQMREKLEDLSPAGAGTQLATEFESYMDAFAELSHSAQGLERRCMVAHALGVLDRRASALNPQLELRTPTELSATIDHYLQGL